MAVEDGQHPDQPMHMQGEYPDPAHMQAGYMQGGPMHPMDPAYMQGGPMQVMQGGPMPGGMHMDPMMQAAYMQGGGMPMGGMPMAGMPMDGSGMPPGHMMAAGGHPIGPGGQLPPGMH